VTWPVRREADPDAAKAALAAAAGTARDAAELASVLPREDVHLLVAHDGGVPVGVVIGYELPRLLRAGTGMLLYSIDVAATHRRRGVGRALVAGLRELARERGCDATWLLTNASNEPAMALYAAAGLVRPNPDDVMWEAAEG
jgi:ribosomal protein S18 acetylase RimI-like enzyme